MGLVVAALFEAVETKLTEQRNFVIWWDGEGKHPGNRGSGRGKIRPSQISDGLKIKDLPVDKDTLHRWRTRLKGRTQDLEKLNKTVADSPSLGFYLFSKTAKTKGRRPPFDFSASLA